MNRREADLLEQDILFLDGLGYEWEVIRDGSTWVLIHGIPLPEGYTESRVTMAIRLEAAYPIGALDMMYLHPRVGRKDGKAIIAADVVQQLDQKDFQRWSRHRSGDNPWQPGQDSLETHFYLMEDALHTELSK